MIVAPCKVKCSIDKECRELDRCLAWQIFKHELELEREERKMKCPKCHNNMERKQSSQSCYYYECPNCHHEVGKQKENSNERENE